VLPLLLSAALASPLPDWPAQAEPAEHDCRDGGVWVGGDGWIEQPADCDLIGLPPVRASYLRKVEVWAEGCRDHHRIEAVDTDERLTECAAEVDAERAKTAACEKDQARQRWQGRLEAAGVGAGLVSVLVIVLVVL
jgi:hypothetical protein